MIDKKIIQARRMMRYFLEAAHSIIDNEGVSALTARKVADLAGYNVATLYNYFENLDHLIFFASLRYLKNYAISLPEYTKDVYQPIPLYLKVWECFNHYAFLDPLAYKHIFFGKYNSQYNQSLKLYYEIFPEELPKDGLRFFPMLQEHELHKRDYMNLKAAAQKGLLPESSIREISEINTCIFGGMLHRFLTDHNSLTAEEAAIHTTSCQAHTLIGYGVAPKFVQDFIK